MQAIADVTCYRLHHIFAVMLTVLVYWQDGG